MVVRYSSEDGRHEGFDAIMVEDACRGIDVQGSMLATRAAAETSVQGGRLCGLAHPAVLDLAELTGGAQFVDGV